ncbi:hypothetical protein MKW11_12335 [Gluconobacter frateurii]|uniref:hypothetical protein n=1 Tax=Gluconobacter frateurii TaxID=38308 RepID=UPI001F063057|nr:hypothetical protein [Gluconobacter frateurii]UMM07981.1 hypothetical protein MKW11_12335 [Gluconobacter frateurii]
MSEICGYLLARAYANEAWIEDLISDFGNFSSSHEEKYFDVIRESRNLNVPEDCSSECDGKYDFISSERALNSFLTEIVNINHKHTEIINHICNEFSVVNKKIEIESDIFSAKKYIEQKLDSSFLTKFINYINDIELCIKRLSLEYYSGRIAKCNDIIISHAGLSSEQNFSFKKSKCEKTIFYVDQNFISKLSSSPKYLSRFRKYIDISGSVFAYSSYATEDGIKMNKLYLKEYFKSLSDICNNNIFIKCEGELSFGSEEIENTVDRVLLWYPVTEAAENIKIFQPHIDDYMRDEKKISKDVVSEINDDINKFLQNIDDNLYEYLSGYILFKAYSFSLKDLINKSVKCDSDADFIDNVKNIWDFLDFIKYKVPKKSDKRKLKSSYRDSEHLMHAWKADFFITDDENLKYRGNFIYSVININTEFFGIREFDQKITDYIRKHHENDLGGSKIL